MILYIEIPKDSIRKLLELTVFSAKLQDTKSVHRNASTLALIYTNNEKSEREMKE